MSAQAVGNRVMRGAALVGVLVLLTGVTGCTVTQLQRELNAQKRRNVELLHDRDQLERQINVAKGEQDSLKQTITDLTVEVQTLRGDLNRSAAGVATSPVSGESEGGGITHAIDPTGGEATGTTPAVAAGPTGFEGIDGVVAERGDGGEVRLILTQVLFPAGMATLRKSGETTLDRIGMVLLGSYKGHAVCIEGHTDNTPVNKVKARYPSNWELSSARASAVLRALVQHDAVDPSRASVAGFGDTRPLAPNDSEEGRRRNRRVEIVVNPDPTSG